MQNSLKAILFDADGVIQRPAIDYASAFATLAPLQSEQLDALIGELFAVERPALTDHRDFRLDLASVLSRWNLVSCIDDVLRIWTSIETDSTMIASIGVLRSLGIQCCLASNQQAHRGSHMSDTLRYCDVFDFQFYSYRLGVAKPAPEYFRAILRHLGLSPSEILFIDDHEPNVTAAREVGLHGSLFTATPPSSACVLRDILLQHGVPLTNQTHAD